MTADHIIEKIREAMYGSMDKALTSADRLRILIDDPELFTGYISEDAEWAIESLEALLLALEAAEAERDALRKSLVEKIHASVRQALVDAAHVYRGQDGSLSSAMFKAETIATNAIADFMPEGARTLAGDNHE